MIDIHTRTGGVDLLNRSLLTDFLPVQAARALGLSALGNFTWLRKLAMRHGLGAKEIHPHGFGFPFRSREKDPQVTDLSR